jgi:hypothetical protein
MDTAGLRVSTKQTRNFPSLTSVMSQDLGLQRATSRLQRTYANHWMFPINIISLLMIQSPLLIYTELHYYSITCILFSLGLNFSLVLIPIIFLAFF